MSSLATYVLQEFEFEGTKRQYYYVTGSGNRPYNALVVALHPFTGSPEWMYQKYEAIHRRGFHMLIPVGHENSWNGGACCGSAVRLGLNDVGFIQELVAYVTRTKLIRPARAYIVGHSNGAFLASEIALRATSHDSAWVRAVAMVVGYSYDRDLYEAALKSARGNSGVPVLALHGTADRAVHLEGCCDEEDECCCGIISRTCFSFQDELHQWAKINRCASVLPSKPAQRALSSKNMTCFIGKGCAAPIQFCEVPHAGHDIQNMLPVGEAVAEWFAADFTKQHDYLRNNVVNNEIGDGTVRKPGRPQDNPNPRIPHSQRPGRHDNVTGVAIIVFFLVAVFFFLALVFKRNVTKPAAILKGEANARELQSLTGRSTANTPASQ